MHIFYSNSALSYYNGIKASSTQRYLFPLNRSRIPKAPGSIWSSQLKIHFFPVMRLFILLSLTVFSDAMVMDEKVKESFVLDTASAICNYDNHYKDHPKYWCRGYFRDYCNIIAFTPNSTDRVALRDTGNQLIVTVSCLTKEDTGWYWCGIQRDFARDDMDFTELVVTDDRRAITNNFWSGQDLSGNKNRSCRASKVVHKADHSRAMDTVCDSFQDVHSHHLHTDHGLRDHLHIQPFVPKEEKPKKQKGNQRNTLGDGETVGITIKQTPLSSGYGNVENSILENERTRTNQKHLLMKHKGLQTDESETQSSSQIKQHQKCCVFPQPLNNPNPSPVAMC
ncbi:hypothetical protein E5288_WYG007032 [Bos mutus]|uniref:Transmembrane and immunoglobulin domain containing 3 n=1 Tax=Bos mutus TaxID=72004 RepID=A0A6B0QNY4_9CETA|nr:hypothetical protein [Bos mutus]